MTRTKILSTIGPSISTKSMIEKVVDAGVDGFRLNFSHGKHEEFEQIFKNIEEVSSAKNIPIAVLIDLQGPKIRIGEIEGGSVQVKKGDKINITTRNVRGNKNCISTSYKYLPRDARLKDKILIEDGIIHLKVIGKDDKTVTCVVESGGIIKSRKGINLPGMKLSTPSITRKDYGDLSFAVKHRFDFVALSFVRSADDILKLRKWLKKNRSSPKIIAKIEKPEAVENFEEILEVSDGIMVARGDLGVEMEPFEVPVIQKRIISRARACGKLVITATQMLESMINNPIPTRAEASDVANAVLDGTDVVMLSGETSVGKHPVKTVQMMDNILNRIELHSEMYQQIKFEKLEDISDNLFDASGRNIVSTAIQLSVSAIVIFTQYGRMAKVISKFRPPIPIYTFTNLEETRHELNLYWGIESFRMKNIADKESTINEAEAILKKSKLIKKKDILLFASGSPITDDLSRNWMKYKIV